MFFFLVSDPYSIHQDIATMLISIDVVAPDLRSARRPGRWIWYSGPEFNVRLQSTGLPSSIPSFGGDEEIIIKKFLCAYLCIPPHFPLRNVCSIMLHVVLSKRREESWFAPSLLLSLDQFQRIERNFL